MTADQEYLPTSQKEGFMTEQQCHYGNAIHIPPSRERIHAALRWIASQMLTGDWSEAQKMAMVELQSLLIWGHVEK